MPRIAREGHGPDVLDVGSELVLVMESSQPGRSLAEPRMDRAGRVEIAAREDLVTAAQVFEGLVQESPVLESLGRKLAGLGVKELFFNPPQVVGSAFSAVHVGVIARVRDSCSSPVVVDKQIEYPGLLFSFLL